MGELPVALDTGSLETRIPVRALDLRLLAANSAQWFRKGAFAIADQALFSGSNFLVNVLLARWLTPAQYGAYSLAYAVFLLFAGMHTAVLTEPMVVFGAGKYRSHFNRYLRTVVSSHWAVMLPASLLMLVVAVFLGRVYSRDAQDAFLGLVVGAGAILLFWIVRRVFYILLQPGWAVAGGALYLVAILGAVAALRTIGRLSSFTAFLGMAAASVITSMLLLARFFREPKEESGALTFSTVAVDHWRYGRWALGSAVISWFPGQVYYALLPAWLGLEGSAALRALMNFAMPVLQAISALSMLLLPALVRNRQSEGGSKMTRTMLGFLALFLSGSIVYCALLWTFRQQIFHVFYGGKYEQYSGWPMLLVGLLPFGTCASAVLGSGLRAIERPDLILWCYIASAISSVAFGIPLAAKLGVSGALLGLLISSLVTVALMGWFWKRPVTPCR
jgi:O-antigen/teichoic acid export membrane protein